MADLIHEFFATNRVIVLSIYGQVFFVLGVALALQSWQHSRLALARSLKWLAAFGLTHGLHEWGDVFIPIQAQYLAPPFIVLLLALQNLLLAVSFLCLFQFGVDLLRPLPDRWHGLLFLPAFILALWILWSIGPAGTIFADASEWYRTNNALARYSLGFPGALLAAYGLRRQADVLISPLEVPHIWRMLRIVGLALAGYGVFAGLIVPEANFFPANWLNDVNFEALTLIPIQVARSALGLIMVVAMIRALEVFQVELNRQLNRMEEEQILLTERERIGRELHDGTLQTIYAAGLLLKTTEKEIKGLDCPRSSHRIEQSIDLLNQAVADIRGYIGVLRPQPDTHSLTTGLKELASAKHLRSLVEVKTNLDLPEDYPLSSAHIGHLLAIANEGLSNVARHAKASHVELTAYIANHQLHLEIEDDGRGLPNDYVMGYGLRNIRDRARMLGGEMSMTSQPVRGTRLEIKIPWRDGHGNDSSAVG